MGRVCADIGVIENFKGRTRVLDEALSEGKSSVEAFFQEVSARLEAESERIKSVRSKLRQSIQYAESRINELEEENAGYEETISALNAAIAAELAKTTTDEDGKEVPAGDTAKIREWEAEIARLDKLIEKNDEKISQLNDWKEKAEDCERRAEKQEGILAEVIFAVEQAKSEIPHLLQQMQKKCQIALESLSKALQFLQQYWDHSLRSVTGGMGAGATAGGVLLSGSASSGQEGEQQKVTIYTDENWKPYISKKRRRAVFRGERGSKPSITVGEALKTITPKLFQHPAGYWSGKRVFTRQIDADLLKEKLAKVTEQEGKKSFNKKFLHGMKLPGGGTLKRPEDYYEDMVYAEWIRDPKNKDIIKWINSAPEAKSWDFGEHSRENDFLNKVHNNQLILHYFVKQEINDRGVETSSGGRFETLFRVLHPEQSSENWRSYYSKNIDGVKNFIKDVNDIVKDSDRKVENENKKNNYILNRDDIFVQVMINNGKISTVYCAKRKSKEK